MDCDICVSQPGSQGQECYYYSAYAVHWTWNGMDGRTKIYLHNSIEAHSRSISAMSKASKTASIMSYWIRLPVDSTKWQYFDTFDSLTATRCGLSDKLRASAHETENTNPFLLCIRSWCCLNIHGYCDISHIYGIVSLYLYVTRSDLCV